MTNILVGLAGSAVLLALAQAPRPVSEGEVIHVTGTIEKLDPATREVTVKVEGELHTFSVKPDVKRFGELKVGDQLAFDYHEAILMEVRKPGAAAPKAAAKGEEIRVAGKGTRPSGAVVQQQVATVVVKAIDPTTPSITILTESAETVTMKVRHPERLKGLKVGDKIDVTYTEALIVSVQ